MRKKLDFDEISGWQEFEDLVADYFREIGDERNITSIEVSQSGEGSDGGRDILVTFQMSDSVVSFTRKWVVQCKFYKKSVGKSELSTVNIPTLIHEYGADGYLLVCKNNVTSRVSDMFENLKRECKLEYSYLFWSGTELKNRIRFKPELIARYFPEHNEFLQLQKGKLIL